MKGVLRVVMVGVMLAGLCSVSYAEEAAVYAKSGDLGIGVDLNAVNLGIGPLAKYWITDNIGVQGTATFGVLTGYSVRGFYAFDRELLISGQKMRPYAGIGYASASRKDTFAAFDVTTKGSGPQVFGGVEGKIPLWGPNFYWTGEVAYSPIKLEGTGKGPLGIEVTYESDYNAFAIGGSLVYYFPVGRQH